MGASPSPASLSAERHRLSLLRHQRLLELMEQLDLLSLPLPFSLPPDSLSLSQHLLNLLYELPKGRLLILRSLQRLPPPHSLHCLVLLNARLPATTSPPSHSKQDEALAVLLAELLYSAPPALLLLCYSQLLHPPTLQQLVDVARTKLGCMLLQVFMRRGHDMEQQPQQPQQPPLPQLQHELQLWASVTQRWLAALEGRWQQVLDGLPSRQQTAAASASSLSFSPAWPSSSPPMSPLASARAVWDLLSQVLAHLSAQPAEAAALQRLRAELEPLLRSFLLSAYRFEQEAEAEDTAAAAAPVLLPVLSPSLLSLCLAVLPADDPLPGQAVAAQKQSEAAVRRFIADRQQRASRQQQQQRVPAFRQPAAPPASALQRRSDGQPAAVAAYPAAAAIAAVKSGPTYASIASRPVRAAAGAAADDGGQRQQEQPPVRQA